MSLFFFVKTRNLLIYRIVIHEFHVLEMQIRMNVYGHRICSALLQQQVQV